MSNVSADIVLDIKGVELEICVCADVDSDHRIDNKEFWWTNPANNKEKKVSDRLAQYIDKHFEDEVCENLFHARFNLADDSDCDYDYDVSKDSF